MIDLKKLKELVKLMVDNELTEVDLQDQAGEKVSLRRGSSQPVQVISQPVAAAPVQAAAPAPAAPAAAAPAAPAAASADEGLIPITSPMVGTFYAASSPDAAPFIKVGDRVTPDTVVCIVEAMKVFNEIKAETSGTVAKVLKSNGQPVEFGQPLFLLKP